MKSFREYVNKPVNENINSHKSNNFKKLISLLDQATKIAVDWGKEVNRNPDITWGNEALEIADRIKMIYWGSQTGNINRQPDDDIFEK